LANKLNTFIVAHQDFGYEIPFPHEIIGLDGFSPSGAINIDVYLPSYMRSDRTFASYRAGWGILELLRQKGVDDQEFLAIWGYRHFFGNKFLADLTQTTTENTKEDPSNPYAYRTFQTPEEIKNSWNETVLLDIPDGIELIVTRPEKFPVTVAEQYAQVHHFEDLMFGVGLAIKCGCINPSVAATVLSKQIFVPGFVGRISLYNQLYEKLFLIATEFYDKHYVQREGYQARTINFVLERICAIFIIQKIYFERAPAVSTNLIQISENGHYIKGS
jgi:hypothetical protein